MSDQSLGDQSDGTKKGYSIGSLLVIMTLLAVWMAVPRRIGESTEPPIYLCFVIVHQLVFWTTIAASLWMATGKRKAVRYFVTASILLFIAPLLLLLIETTIYKNLGYQLFSAVLTSLACQDPYVWTMTEIFGYDF